MEPLCIFPSRSFLARIISQDGYLRSDSRSLISAMTASRMALEVYFKNLPYLRKTVIVKENELTPAFQALTRILRNDKVVNTFQAQTRYEKPTRWRRRVMYERCKRIYDSEMARKIDFISRVNRVDPWPR
ncbi:28S ribosomal protein S21, mitochondrial [Clonorchis sinensis]|uniref:28S ribosomal protein S21, mitochondrial n=2 Tax=Clonorchis sinensis TaxID=79923 RepID=A0A8T1MRY4_CLOSI|nr:28S ribosomal protein S21, mitochondrial [Clonorchis sinensis]GAA49026.1 28S ribosomal protein S21 mitochondrial [Clonorchis sinensis]